MFYQFPIIKHINDVLPAIAGSDEFKKRLRHKTSPQTPKLPRYSYFQLLGQW
jgi:hypothetical protein